MAYAQMLHIMNLDDFDALAHDNMADYLFNDMPRSWEAIARVQYVSAGIPNHIFFYMFAQEDLFTEGPLLHVHHECSGCEQTNDIVAWADKNLPKETADWFIEDEMDYWPGGSKEGSSA